MTEFKYLVSIFTEDGRFNREVKTRVQKANNVSYHLAKAYNIPIETKAKLINSIFILTYQCQTSTLTKSLDRKITTCEMRCLRRAVNKTRRDMIRNEHIREMVGTTPAHRYIQQHQHTTTYNNTSPPLHTTTPAHHYIQQQRIKWFGHLTRMATNQLALKAYNTRVAGFKARGRPTNWPSRHTTPGWQASKREGDQPTGPLGIQHQDGRLQSERETNQLALEAYNTRMAGFKARGRPTIWPSRHTTPGWQASKREGDQPTGPLGIQHQDGRLQSERETNQLALEAYNTRMAGFKARGRPTNWPSRHTTPGWQASKREGDQPTGPRGIQHQDGRLQSERETNQLALEAYNTRMAGFKARGKSTNWPSRHKTPGWQASKREGDQPTGPRGIQHQDGRLQSERERPTNWPSRHTTKGWQASKREGDQPTGPRGIQHQDGRLQSERETNQLAL